MSKLGTSAVEQRLAQRRKLATLRLPARFALLMAVLAIYAGIGAIAGLQWANWDGRPGGPFSWVPLNFALVCAAPSFLMIAVGRRNAAYAVTVLAAASLFLMYVNHPVRPPGTIRCAPKGCDRGEAYEVFLGLIVLVPTAMALIYIVMSKLLESSLDRLEHRIFRR